METKYNVIKTINGKYDILYNVGNVLISDNESLINFMLENEFIEPMPVPVPIDMQKDDKIIPIEESEENK